MGSGRIKMDPISPPLEPLQVRVRQIPPEADSSLPSHAANENSSASAEELPQVPSSKYPGTERAIRISRRDEQLPPMRLDKGKGRALSPSRPDDDEPLKGLSFRDELYAIGDVVTSSSVAEHQPVRHSVGWPPSGEPSGYNTATFCSRDYSPVFAGGDAPSAGYASGGYTTVHLRDTALASSPAVSRSAPTVSSGKVTTPSNTSTAAVPPVKGMFGVAPLITGLSLFAPPGKGPFYEPPPSRPPIPLFEPSPGLGYGCSACPIVIDDAPARHPARRGSPPQQAGLPTEVAVSSQPPDRSSSSQLGASSSTPIVIDDGTSQTRASEPSEPIDLGTPSPPPDAVVNRTYLPCPWCATCIIPYC